MFKYRPNYREQQLINALRSGKYVQTRSALRNEYGYCCLGVACEISGMRTWKNGCYTVGTIGDSDYRSAGGILDQDMADYYGWGYTDGMLNFLNRDGETVDLTECNDILELTFDQIADLIEHGLIA